jgi:sec-independent protein translocase protein TatC
LAAKRNPESKMSLGGHLKELRNRLFWSAIFIFAATVGGWFLFDPVFQILQAPVIEIATKKGVNATINFGTVVSAFDLRLQVSIFIGLLLSSPFWLFNLWAFITPGLKTRERRFTLGFVFSAVPLFALGCWLAWISMPSFVETLIGFTPQGSANVINASEYILFTIRILLVFGIAFVLPVVLVLLNFAGLITAKSIVRSWRIAIFIIAVVAALATPTADPMSMFLVMVPLIVLYFAAAGISALNDKRRERKVAAIDKQIEATTNNPNEA